MMIMWLSSSFTRLVVSNSSSAIANSNRTVRHFSKFLSKAAAKSIPLTTKRAKKGFYKGKGCTKEGHITSTAKFVVDWNLRLQLVVPDLTGFKLKPYIAKSVPKFSPETRRSASLAS